MNSAVAATDKFHHLQVFFFLQEDNAKIRIKVREDDLDITVAAVLAVYRPDLPIDSFGFYFTRAKLYAQASEISLRFIRDHLYPHGFVKDEPIFIRKCIMRIAKVRTDTIVDFTMFIDERFRSFKFSDLSPFGSCYEFLRRQFPIPAGSDYYVNDLKISKKFTFRIFLTQCEYVPVITKESERFSFEIPKLVALDRVKSLLLKLKNKIWIILSLLQIIYLIWENGHIILLLSVLPLLHLVLGKLCFPLLLNLIFSASDLT